MKIFSSVSTAVFLAISAVATVVHGAEPSPWDIRSSGAAPEALPVMVGEADGGIRYDLADISSAQDYVDRYADNVQLDPSFAKHVGAALDTIRGKIPAYGTFWAVFPPLLAIILALISKEVYSSLFLGILAGGLIYSGFHLEGTVVHVFSDGFIDSVSNAYNIGILFFLVLLGSLGILMIKAGGAAAFGRWAAAHIKSRKGAQLATILLGISIFVDDYFNCLTVGSVMRPVADAKHVSRAKLAYLIDSTAAPVCIIAPISSWAAAVAGFAKGAGEEGGFSLFISAIPYNFYAILTIVMIFFLAMTGFDFGLMRIHERNAIAGKRLSAESENSSDDPFMKANRDGHVIDLIVPVLVLVISCVIGMIYSGGYFTPSSGTYRSFIHAFSNSDASLGLVYGASATLAFSILFYLFRRAISFRECMQSLPEGFKAMVPAIVILCSAWTLKTMTDSLGAKIFISQLINGHAAGLHAILPAVVFLISLALAFSTGASWGAFGILIPIVLAAVPGDPDAIIAISACMAGAVCGDHCSPISDTTIMSSVGARCDLVSHVSTQFPYAATVACVCIVGYLIAPLVKSWTIALPIAVVLMVATLVVMKAIIDRKGR